ncbi:hypothetical protein A7M65_19410 [Acinetobacter baumannii]|nr:hypothetical protein A7M65_19410 [Acinetobacter baumannii]
MNFCFQIISINVAINEDTMAVIIPAQKTHSLDGPYYHIIFPSVLSLDYFPSYSDLDRVIPEKLLIKCSLLQFI